MGSDDKSIIQNNLSSKSHRRSRGDPGGPITAGRLLRFSLCWDGNLRFSCRIILDRHSPASWLRDKLPCKRKFVFTARGLAGSNKEHQPLCWDHTKHRQSETKLINFLLVLINAALQR